MFVSNISWRLRYAILGGIAIYVLGTLLGVDRGIVTATCWATSWMLCCTAGWWDANEKQD